MRTLTNLELAEYNDIKSKYFLFCNTFYADSLKPTITFKINKNNEIFFILYLETITDIKSNKGYTIPTGYKEVFIKGSYLEICEHIKNYANIVFNALKERNNGNEKSI